MRHFEVDRLLGIRKLPQVTTPGAIEYANPNSEFARSGQSCPGWGDSKSLSTVKDARGHTTDPCSTTGVIFAIDRDDAGKIRAKVLYDGAAGALC
jgi:hypothetical protein